MYWESVSSSASQEKKRVNKEEFTKESGVATLNSRFFGQSVGRNVNCESNNTMAKCNEVNKKIRKVVKVPSGHGGICVLHMFAISARIEQAHAPNVVVPCFT